MKILIIICLVKNKQIKLKNILFNKKKKIMNITIMIINNKYFNK